MNHLGTVKLETPRLLLRRFVPRDAAAMFNNWAYDTEVTRYLSWHAHESVADSQKIIHEWHNHYKKRSFYTWAIVLKPMREPIGSISVVDLHSDVDSIEIGYCISRDYWHKGIVSESLAALIKFFFERVGVNRIETWYDPENYYSGRVMDHCGMTCEGTLRQTQKTNRGLRDSVIYAMLAEDYFARKAEAAEKIKGNDILPAAK